MTTVESNFRFHCYRTPVTDVDRLSPDFAENDAGRGHGRDSAALRRVSWRHAGAHAPYVNVTRERTALHFHACSRSGDYRPIAGWQPRHP